MNVGSTSIDNKELEFLLSLLPNGLKHLELHLDSISATQGFGSMLAYQLNKFTLLKSLTVSLVLSLQNEKDELGIFFKLHKPR